MKKLLLGLIALVSIVCFNACSNDNEQTTPKRHPIVGTWELNMTQNGIDVYFTMTFSNKGDFSAKYSVTYNGELMEEVEESGKYVCDDTHVTITYDDGDIESMEYIVNGDELSLTEPTDESITLVFTRKK